MKGINHFFLSAAFLLMLTTSCKKDEVTPPLQVDGLTAFAGKNRAKVEFNAPEGAVKGKVFFNNGDYQEFDITTTRQTVIVEGLSEQEHVLRVVTLNAADAVSDPKSVKVSVYGQTYESGLKPRKWKDQRTDDPGSVELVFDPAFSNETTVRVVYFTTSGARDSVTMAANQNTVVLNNIDTDQDYFYYSVYKPETSSIDSFFSTPLSVKTAMMMDFQKDKWIVEAKSGETPGYNADNIIDNNSNTSWRSQQGDGLPQSVTVDMGNPKVIDGFYYVKMPGQNNDGPKELKIEVSQNQVDWRPALTTSVAETYLRQLLPLPESVAARYFRITVTATINPGATQAGFAEIDAYNTLNQSGVNGYTKTTPVALVNASAPFSGDGSNLLPAVGAGRMQRVEGWTHNSNANISYDNTTRFMNPFSAAIWGAPAVSNGKIHQTLTLSPGDYLLQIESGATEGPVEIYGVAATGTSLPDYNAVAGSAETLQFADLMAHQNKIVELLLNVTKETPVSIGVVFNLPDRYPQTGIAWTHFTVKGFNLQKIE